MWNMKKYRIVVGVWMLLLSSASCMDDTGRYGQDNRNYRITASIEDANVASRVADKNNRTSFTKNDEIFIGWSGSASYKYLCSGTDNVFVPNASDANRELWTGLLNASSTKDVVRHLYGGTSVGVFHNQYAGFYISPSYGTTFYLRGCGG